MVRITLLPVSYRVVIFEKDALNRVVPSLSLGGTLIGRRVKPLSLHYVLGMALARWPTTYKGILEMNQRF